jgi:hypothetical protein
MAKSRISSPAEFLTGKFAGLDGAEIMLIFFNKYLG